MGVAQRRQQLREQGDCDEDVDLLDEDCDDFGDDDDSVGDDDDSTGDDDDSGPDDDDDDSVGDDDDSAAIGDDDDSGISVDPIDDLPDCGCATSAEGGAQLSLALLALIGILRRSRRD